ncbi:SpoIID/LytB domain-containing protein [bacterium]|nr:SpoIID/LytB domain-containing protein [bacterium]MBU2461364.1 SpoIID/LytB domain-containing protein [bacterium]
MRSILFLLLLANFSFSLDLRVKIAQSSIVDISGTGYFELYDCESLICRRYSAPIQLKATAGGILTSSYGEFLGPVFVYPLLDSYIKIGNRRYRGVFEIRRQGGGLLVINIVDLEEYLYGIIRREISTDWPLESIKAQAVLARTYALVNKKHKNEGFDLCSDVHCQVYGGLEAEDKIAILACSATSGEILLLNEEFAPVYYHACCGGLISDIRDVWGPPGLAYLKSKVCPYCRPSPHYNWQCKLSYANIAEKLNIKKVTKVERAGQDRAREIIVHHEGRREAITANKFRNLFGSNLIKSTYFEIEETWDGIRLIGKGWGHGVGLCQWGAKGMASQGADYEEILSFYFPGCLIKRLSQ